MEAKRVIEASYASDVSFSLFQEGAKFMQPEEDLLEALPGISGINRSYLYMGKSFKWIIIYSSILIIDQIGKPNSFFAWHVEDRFLGSINYGHYGASKMWWCAPAKNFDKIKTELMQFVELHQYIHLVSNANLFEILTGATARIMLPAGTSMCTSTSS